MGEANKSEMRLAFFKAECMSVPPDWNLVMDTLASYGINALAAETSFTIYAHYPSAYVPYGEIILPEAIDAAHARGIKFYAHFNTLLGAHDSTHAVMHASGALGGFSCPTKQVVRTLWQNLTEEILTMYPDIDGIFIDYVRYEGIDNCYCPECKTAFEAYLGETIPSSNWPPTAGGGGDFAPDGSRYHEFMEWRCRPVNDLVRDMAAWARAKNPDIEIVGCVWGVYSPAAPAGYKYYLGQDWFHWVKESYIDWIAGMVYTTDLEIIANCVINAHNWGTGGPQGKVPYVSFLADGAFGYGTSDPSGFNQLVEASRHAGAEGFAIFCYGGPGDLSGLTPDIRPILDAINLFPVFEIRNIVASPTGDACTITWKTSLPATSKVEYNTEPLFTASSKPSPNFPGMIYWDVDHVPGTIVEDAAPATDHSITLQNLLSETTYYYRIQSQDVNGIVTSKVHAFVSGEAEPKVFLDDFELADLSRWTSKEEVNGSIAISDEQAYGIYSAKSIVAGSGYVEARASVRKNLDVYYPILHGGFLVYLDSIGGSDFLWMFSLRSSFTTYDAATIGLNYNRTLRLAYQDGADDLTINSATVLPLRKWVWIELRVVIDEVNGQVNVWMDELDGAGMQEITDLARTGINSAAVGGGGVDYIIAGVYFSAIPATLYTDNVTVDTEPIGPPVAPPIKHSLEIRTTPITGVAVSVDGTPVGDTPTPPTDYDDGEHTVDFPPEVVR